MKVMEKKTTLFLLLSAVLLVIISSGAVQADPCLVVYPSGPCVYYYDPDKYYTVGPEHPLYDPEYDRGGYVLLRTDNDGVDMSIYQAPGLTGFEESTAGEEGFVFIGTVFELIVDGFSNEPTTYVNIIVVFDDVEPEYCVPEITVDEEVISGNTYNLGDLVVETPTPDGNNYSDTVTLQVSWQGCYGIHIWAFADENYNGECDGGECFTAFSHDVEVPTEDATWGQVKSISH